MVEQDFIATVHGEIRRARERVYDLSNQLGTIADGVAEAVADSDAESGALRLSPLVLAGMVASYELAILVRKLTELGTLARDL